jgi:NAD+ synthase (glutamine-hydrolysing)
MPLRLALAQLNPTVGDLAGNLALLDRTVVSLAPWEPDLIVFPELVVTGYPPEDLLGYRRFLQEAAETVDELARMHPRSRLWVGAPVLEGDELYNGAVLLHGGRRIHTYRKCTLPNYGVFDEKRYFRPGRLCPVLRLGGWRIGINICEDIWAPRGVPERQALAGAQLLVNLSSSPYHALKGEERTSLIRHRARQHGTILAYVNLVGGQDELVFDGQSLVVSPTGSILAVGRRFEEESIVIDLEPMPAAAERTEPGGFIQPHYEEIDEIEDELRVEGVDLGPLTARDRPPLPARSLAEAFIAEEEEVYAALVVGTRDYVRKNGFQEVTLGLSGGIDSALTAVIACDALGSSHVHALTMPSRYTSDSSLAGALTLARNLGIDLATVPIETVHSSYQDALRELLGGTPAGVTDENLQARIRGNFLMAQSNQRGWLVLTTGNKSELAVGYCTLYGDMAGGFAVLKDVPKDLVYRIARWRNAHGEPRAPIPDDTLNRSPSAELRHAQRDQDTLPPYPVLDAIIEARIEREEPPEALIARGFDPATVARVYAWIDGNEFKRRQAPPGVKITPRAFGKDRRYPITNRYRPKLR